MVGKAVEHGSGGGHTDPVEDAIDENRLRDWYASDLGARQMIENGRGVDLAVGGGHTDPSVLDDTTTGTSPIDEVAATGGGHTDPADDNGLDAPPDPHNPLVGPQPITSGPTPDQLGAVAADQLAGISVLGQDDEHGDPDGGPDGGPGGDVDLMADALARGLYEGQVRPDGLGSLVDLVDGSIESGAIHPEALDLGPGQ